MCQLTDTFVCIPELGCERSPALTLTRGVLEYGWGEMLFVYCVRGYGCGRSTSLPIKCPLGIAVAIAETRTRQIVFM